MKKSIEIDVTAIEAGLIHILGRPIHKVDQATLVEGLRAVAIKLGRDDSADASLLISGLIEALDDPDSFWKLSLSHRGKGEAVSVQETAKRFAKDAAVTLYVEQLIADGLTKESACYLAEQEFGMKLSTIKATIKRANKRAQD